jgi:hypothetical protein
MSTTGGMDRIATNFYQRLASVINERKTHTVPPHRRAINANGYKLSLQLLCPSEEPNHLKTILPEILLRLLRGTRQRATRQRATNRGPLTEGH